MVVDPTPEEGIPGEPASLFGRSDQVKLVVAPNNVARKDMGGPSENWRILGQPA